MVYITEEMIRKRAEHNDSEIGTLEEVSLHQQNIEKIEHIERWCRNLKILYLQNNLIPRIENLAHLKKLQYLNLALNNIEVIENLEGCESLQKLDLTVNFVGCLSSVESLKPNLHLRELFLVGNPCATFQGYRDYVVVTLPQLERLDGAEISRSERIRASQRLEELQRRLWEQEEEHKARREHEKQEAQEKRRKQGDASAACSPQENQENLEEEEEDASLEEQFWNTPSVFSPESRLEAHHHLEKSRKTARDNEQKSTAVRTLVTAEGRVWNINEPKLEFRLTEDDDTNSVLLDLALFRHMDTSLVDVDVQPTFARVTVKGKIFQIVLPAEVKPDSCLAQRSQSSGRLLLTMPKVGGKISLASGATPPARAQNRQRSSREEKEVEPRRREGPERLEVDPSKRSVVDLTAIVPCRKTSEGPLEMSRLAPPRLTPPTTSTTSITSEEFVDELDVPPLI